MTLLPAAEIHLGDVPVKPALNCNPHRFHAPFPVHQPPRFRRLRDVHEHDLPSHSQSTSTISSDTDSISDAIMDEIFPGSPSSQTSSSISSPAASPAGLATSLGGRTMSDATLDCSGDGAHSRISHFQSYSSQSGMIRGWKPSVHQSPLVDICVSTNRGGLLNGWKPSAKGETTLLLTGNDLPPMSVECSFSPSNIDSLESGDQIMRAWETEDSWASLDASMELDLDAEPPSLLGMPASTNATISEQHGSPPRTHEENAQLASAISKLMSRMISLNERNAELQQQLLQQREQLMAEREAHRVELARVSGGECARVDALDDTAAMLPPLLPSLADEIGNIRWTMSLEDLNTFADDVRKTFTSNLAERAKALEDKNNIPALIQEAMAEFEWAS